MVLEFLNDPVIAEKRPWQLFFIGFAYTTISIFLSLWVFADYASMLNVFLLSLALVPLFYKTMRYEEMKDLSGKKEWRLLAEHSKAFLFLMCLFIGAATAYAFWYVSLPPALAAKVYSSQTQTIIGLNQKVTGNVAMSNLFTKIFVNNVKVMLFCIFFSFVYGTGSLFILMWNASVIGVALGNFFRVHIAAYASSVGFESVSNYLYVISLSILRYAVHGIPEILAYVMAGLAGGIISIAVLRQDTDQSKFERILIDAGDIVLAAVLILFVAGLVEVYITPQFFY